MKEQDYIDQGCEIMNALIETADISICDYPTVELTLMLPCGGVVFGGYVFGQSRFGEEFKIKGWEMGMTAIFAIMEMARVSHWKDLRGMPLRAVLKDGRIVAIGHFLYDKFLDYGQPPFVNDGKEKQV